MVPTHADANREGDSLPPLTPDDVNTGAGPATTKPLRSARRRHASSARTGHARGSSDRMIGWSGASPPLFVPRSMSRQPPDTPRTSTQSSPTISDRRSAPCHPTRTICHPTSPLPSHQAAPDLAHPDPSLSPDPEPRVAGEGCGTRSADEAGAARQRAPDARAGAAWLDRVVRTLPPSARREFERERQTMERDHGLDRGR